MNRTAGTTQEKTAHQHAEGPSAAEIVLADAVLAGAAGLAVWEACARLAAPLWVGTTLEPAAYLARTLGVDPLAGQALHILAGLIVIPLAHMLLLRPALPRRTPWWAAGLLTGSAVWVLAVRGLGSLGAGAMFPLMGPIAAAVLIGHLSMGLAIAGVTEWRGRQPAP
jgi:hypothetical protein